MINYSHIRRFLGTLLTKQHLFWLLLLVGLAAFQLRPYLTAEFPYTHDGENHLARFANYAVAIREGQVPPRWAPNLLNRYGYPVFNYNYPLANILSVPFAALNLNYEVTFKILTSGFVFAGLAGAYAWVRFLTKHQSTRAIAVSTYGLSPYLVTTLTYRGNIGEIAAWALLPWLAWSMHHISETRLNTNKKPKTFQSMITFLGSVFIWTGFFLAHNIFALFGSGLMVVYAGLVFKNHLKSWLSLGLRVTWAGALSFWFWLPALLEKKYIVLDEADLTTSFGTHFPTFGQLMFSPARFGFSYPGPIDSLSFYLGLTCLLALLIGTSVLVFQLATKQLQLLTVGLWLVSLALLVFQLSPTILIWETIPLAHFIQFPWRLGLLFGLMTTGLLAVSLDHFSVGVKRLLALLLIWQTATLAAATPVDYFHKLNRDYQAFTQTTSTANENLPKTFHYQNIGDWQAAPIVLSPADNHAISPESQTDISINYWRGSSRSYTVKTKTPITIVEPTAVFPGWNTTITNQINNNQSTASYLDNDQIQGRLAFELPAGEYQITTKFTQNTWPRLVGNGVGLFGLLAAAIYVGWTGWQLFSPLQKHHEQ